MSRNAKTIIGVVCVVIGLILFASARGEMSSNSYYTFKPPYTSYEMGVLARLLLGVGLLASGIGDLIMAYISRKHESNNIQTPYGSNGLFADCPKCGLKMSNTSTKCPKCGTKLKYRNGKFEVDE